MSWFSLALPSFLSLNRSRVNLRTIAEPPAINGAPAPIFNFSGTALQDDYPNTVGKRYYVKIIDDLFSLDECRVLINFAETGVFDFNDAETDTADEPPESGEGSQVNWEPAAVHTKSRHQIVDIQYRNSDRVLRFSNPVSSWVFDRLLPHIADLVEIGPNTEWEKVVGKPSGGEIWRLVGLNERLSFLRYGKGMYFKEHLDSHVTVKDREGNGARCGRVTIQIYLASEATEVRESSRVESASKSSTCDERDFGAKI